MTEFHHISVFAEEAVDVLQPRAGGLYIDCTLGGAGHSESLLKKSSPDGKLIAIDQDMTAIHHAREQLAAYEGRFQLVHANFRDLQKIAREYAPDGVDGVLFDLGVSSPQLDEADRGFSYMQDAALDMRMNPEQKLSAFEVVNRWSEDEISDIIFRYGEEKWGKRIAQFIVNRRKQKPIETTGDLVDLIKAAVPAGARRDGPHPAKRTFQAIRIAVNDELNVFEKALKDAVDVLRPGGRVAVITFHSLEDRIAKQVFQELAKDCICPPDFPICTCNHQAVVKLVGRKPILPSESELERNPRARSAKLRVAEKR